MQDDGEDQKPADEAPAGEGDAPAAPVADAPAETPPAPKREQDRHQTSFWGQSYSPALFQGEGLSDKRGSHEY